MSQFILLMIFGVLCFLSGMFCKNEVKKEVETQGTDVIIQNRLDQISKL